MKKMIVLLVNLFLIGSTFAAEAWTDCSIQPDHAPSAIYVKHLYIRSNGDTSYSIDSKDLSYSNKKAYPSLTRDGLTFALSLDKRTVWMTLSTALKGVTWNDPQAPKSSDRNYLGEMEIRCSPYEAGE